jgi:hypothetical protein
MISSNEPLGHAPLLTLYFHLFQTIFSRGLTQTPPISRSLCGLSQEGRATDVSGFPVVVPDMEISPFT